MYTKDKSNRITLRLNDAQFEFVTSQADALDVSPSDFLRMVINVSMVSTQKLEQKLDEKVKKGVSGRENDTTVLND